MLVFVIQVESVRADHGNAMIFDSVWRTYEAAQEYAKKFKTLGYPNQVIDFDIFPETLGE